MVTQFHTLLHFVTLNHTIFIPTAALAASIRIAGVSKSHLLSDFTHIHTLMRIAQAIAAGPIHTCHTRPLCLWASQLSKNSRCLLLLIVL